MKNARNEAGSVTIYVLTVVSILTIVAGVVLRQVQEAHTNTFRAAGWQEAMLAAESGIDMGISELRKTAASGAAWQSPWTATTSGGAVTASAQVTLGHAGEGGNTMISEVSIDSPASLVDPKGWRYYRIRSKGTDILSGTSTAGMERRDSALRKYSLKKDRFTGQ